MADELFFGLKTNNSKIECCGSPEVCTSNRTACAFKNSPRKNSKFTWERCKICGWGDHHSIHFVTKNTNIHIVGYWNDDSVSPHDFLPSGIMRTP